MENRLSLIKDNKRVISLKSLAFMLKYRKYCRKGKIGSEINGK